MRIAKIRDWFSQIKIQIFLMIFILSFIIISLFSFVIYYNVSNIFVTNVINNTQATIDQSSKYITLNIDKMKTIANLLVENKSLKLLLSDHTKEDVLTKEILEQIETITQNDAHIRSIFIICKDGRIFSNEKNLDINTSSNMMNENWYKEALNNDMPILTGARMQKLTKDNDSWVISLSREITDEKGENLGVLLIDIHYDFINDYIKNINKGKAGYIYIINDHNELVYHDDATFFNNNQLGEEILKNSYNPKTNRLTYATNIQNTNWTLVGVVFLQELNILKRQVLELVLLTGMITLIANFLFSVYFANKISTPIKKLEKNMINVEKFTPFQVEENSSLEIRQLGQNYNKMIYKIQDLLNQLSLREKTLKEYEINALIGQINPHFLYNTLDTIVWMAEFKESQKVIEITKSLAKFFRLSLSKGEDIISIQQEIDHVSQYLFIQKSRYDDKLNYKFEIDETLLECKVPKIILQPIVENSIYHGIKPLDTSGHILISVQKAKENIEIQIIDDGVGFDQTKSDLTKKDKLSGIGIENVDQRLKLYFGEESGLTIHSAPGKGTVVRLTINMNHPPLKK